MKKLTGEQAYQILLKHQSPATEDGDWFHAALDAIRETYDTCEERAERTILARTIERDYWKDKCLNPNPRPPQLSIGYDVTMYNCPYIPQSMMNEDKE